MESKQNKCFKITTLLFAIITIFYVFYASCSQRGLYLDGSYFFIMFMDRMADGIFTIQSHIEHPRFFSFWISHMPANIIGFLFRNFTDKITYATIYSFALFAIPVLGLLWNYELTKRTKQYAVLFWSVFTYAVIILLYQIFAVTESAIGILYQFVLLNYLLGKIDYTKWDKIGIAFLIIFMFGIYESTVFIGITMFAMMFFCLYDETNPKNILTKIAIGAGSLGASVYTIFFVLMSKDEHSDLPRFLVEATNFFPIWDKLNTMIFFTTIFILFVMLIYKREKLLSTPLIATFYGLYLLLFLKMCNNLQVYLNPIYEQHERTIIVWLIPIIFAGIFIAKLKNIPEQKKLIEKMYIPVLLCGITLSAWQIVTTYYWNQNVAYMKECINNSKESLYIPSTDSEKEIASFFSPTLRRFIWNANFVSTALALEPNVVVNKIILHYENDEENVDNPSQREQQFVVLDKGVIGMPYFGVINIKNKFWDLTEPAKALEEYNKKHSIKTNEEQFQDVIDGIVFRRIKRK